MTTVMNGASSNENVEIKEEFQRPKANELDTGIELTKFAIVNSLERLVDTSGCFLNIDFITKECLERPPFPFIHALVTIYCRHLSFARGLYKEEEYDVRNVEARQDKLRFLFKILVCAAKITKESVDVYVSPVKILGGQDVAGTHTFLRCLAKASRAPLAVSAAVGDEIVKTGVNTLYQKSVKARNLIVRIQAIVRGGCVRTEIKRRQHLDYVLSTESHPLKDVRIECDLPSELGSNVVTNPSIIESISPDTSDEEDGHDDTRSTMTAALSLTRTDHDDVTLSSSQSVATSKSDEKCTTVKVCERESTRKAFFNAKRTRNSVERPVAIKAIPEIDTKKDTTLKRVGKNNFKIKTLKKGKVLNGVVTRQTLEVREPMQDDEERKTKIKTIQEMEVEIKRKLKRLKEREAKLEGRIQEIKHTEDHLQMHEGRVKRLADNLRKQQDKVKQDGIRQAMELDKFRLETSYRSQETRDPHDPLSQDFQFSEALLKQACGNQTITDLRLALERKERSLTKRSERMIKIENTLRQRIIELEGIKESTLKGQSEQSWRQTNTARTIHVQKKKILQEDTDDHVPVNNKDNSASVLDQIAKAANGRRQAFVPSTAQGELKEIHVQGLKTLSSIKANKDRPPIRHLSIPSLKDNILSTITEEADVDKSSSGCDRKSLPRSLISYSNLYNDNSQQNYVALGI